MIYASDFTCVVLQQEYYIPYSHQLNMYIKIISGFKKWKTDTENQNTGFPEDSNKIQHVL